MSSQISKLDVVPVMLAVTKVVVLAMVVTKVNDTKSRGRKTLGLV